MLLAGSQPILLFQQQDLKQPVRVVHFHIIPGRYAFPHKDFHY